MHDDQYDQEDGETILAVAYDTPIPGYKTHNCNVLRLWKAIPTDVSVRRGVNSRKSTWRSSTWATTRRRWRAGGARRRSRACCTRTTAS